MQSTLNSRVRAYIKAYRKHEKASKRADELIRQDAWTLAMEFKSLVSRQAKLWRRLCYERYGLDVRRWVDKDPTDWSSLPRKLSSRETTEIVGSALAYTYWECARRLTLAVERAAIDAGVDRNLAICAVLMFLGRRDKEPADWHSVCSGLPQALKEELLAEQAGRLGSQVSLDRNKRLRAALSGWDGGPFDNLVRELPGAVLAAYAEPTDDAHRRSFVTQVARMLEELGSETAGRSDKLTSLASEVPLDAADDEGVAEFERKETLDALERAAKLSPQQSAVWERLRQGKSILEIAVELTISENQVSVQKCHAIKKLGIAGQTSNLS